jgi:hypothetical protein
MFSTVSFSATRSKRVFLEVFKLAFYSYEAATPFSEIDKPILPASALTNTT